MTWTALAKAAWDDDVAEVKKLIASGASLEEICEREDYDVVQRATALGWAVRSWSSPELISVLIAAGARVDAKIDIEGTRETPAEYVRHMKTQFADKTHGQELLEFQREFWDRAPTAAWFDDVECILSQAEAARQA